MQILCSTCNINNYVILRLVKHSSVTTNNVRVVSLEHTVGDGLVDDVQEALYLCQRELDILVYLARLHQFHIGHLCVYKYTSIAKRTKNNNVRIPTLHGVIGGDALNGLLLTHNADRRNLRDSRTAISNQLLVGNGVYGGRRRTAVDDDYLVWSIQCNVTVYLLDESGILQQNVHNGVPRNIPLERSVFGNVVCLLEVELNLTHLFGNVCVGSRPNLGDCVLVV